MTTRGDLLKQQEELQAEAGAVGADLRLDEVLSAVGKPVRVGSAALGVMVRRDLDITVVCPALDAALWRDVAQIGAGLAVHARVRQVQFRNDTGAWNIDPGYPDGLYLGAGYRSARGTDWNLDIWFVDQPEGQPDLAHLKSLPARLTPGARIAILRIKHALADSQETGRRVPSYHVYQAVLDDGVRTLEEFTEWQRTTAP